MIKPIIKILTINQQSSSVQDLGTDLGPKACLVGRVRVEYSPMFSTEHPSLSSNRDTLLLCGTRLDRSFSKSTFRVKGFKRCSTSSVKKATDKCS